MPSVNEILDSHSESTPIHDALVAGVDVLGQQQEVEFWPYIRTVLPLDGFVFWLRASLLPADKLAQHGLQSPDSVMVQGSLHYASVGHQVEDETIAVRRVDFTAETQITAFAEIAPDVMYVAEWLTAFGSFKFTFSQRGSYYQQADIHHYVGDAIYPAFATQLIDTVGQFDQRQVVSNSLPLWLNLVSNLPFVSLVTTSVALYPAFLVPPNLVPPYGTVDIAPSTTRAIQAAAYRDANSSRWQLVSETARLTFYGLRNDEVVDFVDYVIDRCANLGDFGVMNTPVVRDERRTQVELAALAQKKVVDFEVNYYQTRARDIARQLIESAVPTWILGDKPTLLEPSRIITPFMAPDDPLRFPI